MSIFSILFGARGGGVPDPPPPRPLFVEPEGTLVLSVEEIIDLARFAGIELDESKLPDEEERETPICIGTCPVSGLCDEGDGVVRHYRMVAWYEEYPEEGSFGLGREIGEEEVDSNVEVTHPESKP